MQQQQKISILGVVIWLIGAMFFLYEFFLRTFLGALGKQIIPALHLTASQFALIASAFYISYGLMQIPVSVIAERLGMKITMLMATLLCCISAYLFAHTNAFYSALLYRLLMGLGGGFAFICLLMITMTWFPRKYFALFIGLGQFIGTMGALCAGGPLANIVSEQDINWRTVFEFIALFGLLLFIMALFFMKNSKKNKQQGRVIYLNNQESIWTKLKQLITSWQAWLVASYSACVFLAVAMLGAVWGTMFLQSLGFSQFNAASLVSFSWLGFAIGCPTLGIISDIFYRRRPIMIFCGILGFVSICLIVYVKLSSGFLYGLLFFILGVTSAGQSIGFAAITEHVKPELKSLALGLNSAFITLLAAAIPLVVGLLIQYSAGNISAKDYSSDNFIFGFSILPILYLV